jgi:hypothetical protein
MQRVAAALAALTAAAGAGLLAAGPAVARPQLLASGPQIWVIHNSASGKCLDADNNHINTLGDKIQLWDCWHGANQEWYWSGSELVNVASGMCLDADNNHITSVPDTVQLWSCWDGPNQQWQTLVIKTNPPIPLITNVGSGGHCLDADPSGVNTNGDTVRLWSCTDAINQQWTWELVSG